MELDFDEEMLMIEDSLCWLAPSERFKTRV